VRTLLIPRSDLGGKSSGAQRYLSYLILAFAIAITLSACVPPTPTPRPTPRPSPTSTLSCEALRSEYCKELHALMERYTWEILPLCDTKPQGWCEEQIVELGQEAARLDAPFCMPGARAKAREFFADLAMIMSRRNVVDEEAFGEALDALTEVWPCR